MKVTDPNAQPWPVRVAAGLWLLLAIGGGGRSAQAQDRSSGPFEKAGAGGKFKPGHYTTLDGQRHAGSIRIRRAEQRNRLQVDQGKRATPTTLAPAVLKSVVIGTDSLIVVRRFQHLDPAEALLSAEPDFCRVKMSGKVHVLEHERLVVVNNGPIRGAGGMVYGGGSSKALQTTWLLRMPTDTSLYVVPTTATRFGPALARLFVDYPALCQQLSAGYAGPDDFKRMVYSYIFRRELGQVTYEAAESIFR